MRWWSLLIVGALALWALGDVGSGFIAALRHDSRFGLSVAGNGRVEAVAPGGAATAAGIRTGDYVALGRLGADERALLTQAEYKPPGTAIVLDVRRGRTERLVRLVSRPDPFTANWPSFAAGFLTSIVFIGVALVLVVARPTSVTWSFLLFACGYAISEFGALQYFLSAWLVKPYIVAVGAALGLAVFGGVTFTARFPNGVTTQAGWFLERISVPVTAVIVALFFSGVLLPGTPPVYPFIRTAYWVALLGVVVLSIGVVIYRHAKATGEDRARGQWVIAGSTLGLAALAADFTLRLLRVPNFSGSPLDVALEVAVILIPLSVAYAVLRHRVIDVRFVINRALVFGILTSGLVLAFSLVEWIVGKELEATRLALYVEMALALVLGFSFDRLKAAVDRLVERAFFRRQHAAAERMRRAVEAVPHAGAVQTVDDLVVCEPLEAYGLSSAALFRRANDGRFERVAALGWSGTGDGEISFADPLVAYLSARVKPLELEEARHDVALPTGDARPEVVVPIVARNELLAFALYGPHESGETIDPEERDALGNLAAAAAAAYDHLETLGLRRELDALRKELVTCYGARSETTVE